MRQILAALRSAGFHVETNCQEVHVSLSRPLSIMEVERALDHAGLAAQVRRVSDNTVAVR